MTEYETTISSKEATWWRDDKSSLDLKHLSEPVETMLEITDPDSMEIFTANVLVCSDQDKLEDPSLLKVFDYESMAARGKHPKMTLYMKLLERIDDPNVQINIRRDKQRFSQMKGEMLKTLLADDKNKH